jgi:hypothetical protein
MLHTSFSMFVLIRDVQCLKCGSNPGEATTLLQIKEAHLPMKPIRPILNSPQKPCFFRRGFTRMKDHTIGGNYIRQGGRVYLGFGNSNTCFSIERFPRNNVSVVNPIIYHNLIAQFHQIYHRRVANTVPLKNIVYEWDYRIRGILKQLNHIKSHQIIIKSLN